MSRVKSFDSTGVAPNGRLYAGDLNAIQDQYSDLTNFTQTHSVGVIKVGEDPLQILRYGAGEMRITGHVRTDGILRGLGGIVPGAFTTTARNAIPLGSRPYGMAILNTTTNQWEWNSGTDASPNWQPIGRLEDAGTIKPWVGPESTIPTGWVMANGVEYSQAGLPALYAALGSGTTVWNTFNGLPAPGAGNFRVPDLRGLLIVGKNNMTGGPTIVGTQRVLRAAAATLGSVAGAEFYALVLAELANHNHGGATSGASADHTHSGNTGTVSADHTHSGSTGTESADHLHVPYPGTADFWGGEIGASGGNFAAGNNIKTVPPNYTGGRTAAHTHSFSTGGISTNHTHAFTTGGRSADHTHTVSAAGSGSAHENVPPSVALNWIIKT